MSMEGGKAESKYGEADSAARELFLKIGLTPQAADDAVNGSAKFRQNLISVITEAKADQGCTKGQGTLLNATASKFPANAMDHRGTLLEYIMSGKLKSDDQLAEAFTFLGRLGAGHLVAEDFDKASGVGVEVSEEEIKEVVAEVIKGEEATLKERRYFFPVGKLLGEVKKRLKFADGATVKRETEAQVEALLGPKTEADLQKPAPVKKVKAKKPAATEAAASADGAAAAAPAEEAWRTSDPYAIFPKPAENRQAHTTVLFSDGTQMHIANSEAKLREHLRIAVTFGPEGEALAALPEAELDAYIDRTGGRVVTRFPPEPNGYLHIGHAKAMFVDFGMAAQYDGVCYLRFDDTNPEAEKQEYIDHIQEIVAWMGWKPWKTTFSSGYFQELYDLAVKLIKDGNAYVCHQTGDEIKESRDKKEPSPYRDRPVEESLALFEDMRRGLVAEGAATLRMRQDHKNDNYNMFDLIAYRIKFVPHPMAGDKWCVYPSYDYTHCLVDALENITHSLCTLEFESRRASYFWLLEVLDTYKPVVWEYSRLNITHNVLSKRKLNKLVTDSYVDGWDDPRLLTLAGLRRRGVTSTAINNFCREIGITRAEGEVHLHKLDYHIRLDLDATAPRSLAVLRPLKVVITNLPDDHFEEVEAKVFPGREETSYKLPFTKVVYIESTDFRETDEKGYFGLAPGKAVMLRYGYTVTCTSFEKSGDIVTEVRVEYDPESQGKKPPKGVLNWVAQTKPGVEPTKFEARLYDVLFKSQNPNDTEDWLADLNPDSLTVVKGAFANPQLAKAQAGDRFQLERLGYFYVDPDSKPGHLVLNRTCLLKESSSLKVTKK